MKTLPPPWMKVEMKVEFEMFYQNILKDISHLNNEVITRLKTKLQHTCDKYSGIKVPYKYCNVINNLCRISNL